MRWSLGGSEICVCRGLGWLVRRLVRTLCWFPEISDNSETLEIKCVVALKVWRLLLVSVLSWPARSVTLWESDIIWDCNAGSWVCECVCVGGRGGWFENNFEKFR